MMRLFGRVLLALLAVAAIAGPASAQIAGQYEPGKFDFYVLSLSWSPSFCAAAVERSSGRKPPAECGARPYAFVVHGLWPQFEKGFPQFCQVPAPRLNHGIISSMLDLMPAPHLIFNEWDRHGTCSGLSPRAYFETVRKARQAVKVPPQYFDLKQAISVSPADVEDAFIKANPQLAKQDMAVGCSKNRLTEVRVCLSRDLKFHACPQVARRSCRRDRLVMPPVRGAPVAPGISG
jgi:ribonuclease T2